MKESLLNKLELLCARHEEISALLSDIETINDQDKFRSLSMEYSQLEDVVKNFNAFQQAREALASAREMLEEDDAEMREMAEEEIAKNSTQIEKLEVELQKLLLPKDPNDSANVFLEIRAGTGGDEAAIFAGDLFRMYSRYAETQKWQLEILNTNDGEHGGYKEIIARIIGHGAYSHLKFESGAHRVQRVPETESQGRVHTSAATVAIIPEGEAVQMIEINPGDLRVDTFRASGAGGQHVNKTDSAIRLTPCQPAPWLNVRMNARNTKTAHARCPYCRPESMTPKNKSRIRHRRPNVSHWSVAATVPNAFVLTIILRAE